MIIVLGAMLARHMVDSVHGPAIVPYGAIELDSQGRGSASEINFECIVCVQLYGGEEGEPIELGIVIEPPDAPPVDAGHPSHQWRDSPLLAVNAVVRIAVPINDGGVYVVHVSLNKRPLVNLLAPITWSKE